MGGGALKVDIAPIDGVKALIPGRPPCLAAAPKGETCDGGKETGRGAGGANAVADGIWTALVNSGTGDVLYPAGKSPLMTCASDKDPRFASTNLFDL